METYELLLEIKNTLYRCAQTVPDEISIRDGLYKRMTELSAEAGRLSEAEKSEKR